MLASYTWSKSLDLVDGDDDFIENAYRHRLTYGLSGWDRKHNFVSSGTYELPFGPGKRMLNANNVMGNVVGGWQFGGIFHLASGQPSEVLANNYADISAFAEMFADQVCSPKTSRVGLQWFSNSSPQCFVQPAPGTYGVGGRNGVRNPRNNVVDFSLVRNFHLYETHQLQFRAEAFNALNHPVLSLGAGQGVEAQNVGVLTVAQPARVLQLALRYSF